MLPLDHPDRIQITFDDHRLVANAGLILPTTLARHLGLPQLVQECLDLGNAPGRANTGDKIMTLVASAPRFRGGRVWLAATTLTTPTCCAPAGRLARSAAPPHPASSKALALGKPVQWRPGTIASNSTPGLTAARLPLTRHPAH